MDVNKARTLYISLADPISLVTEAFRLQAIQTLINKTERGINQTSLLYYDPTRYMAALLQDIFRNDDPLHNFNDQLPSTSILIKDGLKKATAKAVGLKVYITTANLICNFLPHREFTNAPQYEFGLMDDKDAYIANKAITECDHPDDIADSIAQEFEEMQRAFEKRIPALKEKARLKAEFDAIVAHNERIELDEINKADDPADSADSSAVQRI